MLQLNTEQLKHSDSQLINALQELLKLMGIQNIGNQGKNIEAIHAHNIFQEAIKKNRQYLPTFLDLCLKEGSGIVGLENWDKFYNNFNNGLSSLILAEHKSNLDVVIFYYLMNKAKKLESFDKITFIAGRKLNEESYVVRLFAEMFNRLIVVPKSEMTHIDAAETELIYQINYAAQQFLKQNIHNYIYLIYPTGTRSRIWEPETYEGITETVNYLEKFDQVIFMSADGNCMFPIPNQSMTSEPLIADKITIRFSEPVLVKDYIEKQKKSLLKTSPHANRQEIKSFITKSITESIYKQKATPPQEEEWVNKVKDFIKLEKNNKE